jgi:MFS transporter, DHA3 family, macrolide efflux protein
MSDLAVAGRPAARPGMSSFLLIWSGQVVSTFGTGLTTFALSVWVYRKTGLVTRLALIGLFSSVPAILCAPAAGVLVDRFDRRRMMITSDAGTAAMTLVVVALLAAGRLDLVYLYAAMAVASAFTALLWPAYWASQTLLVPRQQLQRASGLDQFGQAASQLLAPAAAGWLLTTMRIEGLLLIDAATYLFSVGMLLLARVPRPAAPAREAPGAGSLWAEAMVGWRFISSRPGLRALLLLLTMINLLAGFNVILATPLVLSTAGPAVLGVVLSVSYCGLLAGGLLMSAQGGPRRRVHGVIGFALLYGVSFVAIGLVPAVTAIAAATFVLLFTVPVINGCSQAIWQSKVAPAFQGRVFAVRRMLIQASLPVAFLTAGPLVDRLLGPALMPGGALAASAGRVLGVGPGRGIGLAYVLLGLAALAGVAAAWASPALQRLEQEVPDWQEES